MRLNGTVENLISDDDGDFALHGHVCLFGANHHIRFVKVKDGDIVEPPDEATEYAKEVFNQMQELNEGAFETCKLPGYAGRYAMIIFPFAD